MHKHTLSLLTLIVSTSILHNNAQAAFRRLPAAVQSVRYAFKPHTALTRQLSSRTVPPATVESQQYVSTAHHSCSKGSKHQNRIPLWLAAGGPPGLAAGIIGWYLALEKEKVTYIEFEEAAKTNDQKTLLKAIDQGQADARWCLEAIENTKPSLDSFVVLWKKIQECKPGQVYYHWFSAEEFIMRATNDEINRLWSSYRTTFDEHFLSLLWLAAAHEKGITAEVLNHAHININTPHGKWNRTVLTIAVDQRDRQAVKWLLDQGADPNYGHTLPHSTLFMNDYDEEIEDILLKAIALTTKSQTA